MLELFEYELKNSKCNFANGRTVRNIFEAAKMKQAMRCFENDEENSSFVFSAEDIENSVAAFKSKSMESEEKRVFGFH